MKMNKYLHKDETEHYSSELFQNPTNEYRGVPFWAWNCKLDEKKLMRQIDCLKLMGFGGFNMHSRAGLADEYLGKTFMKMINVCCKKAEQEDMLAWLYDEDRWPSGSAGGLVTKNFAFRQKSLILSETDPIDFFSEHKEENRQIYFLAAFDIVLNDTGRMNFYKRIAQEESATGIKRYAYIVTAPESGYYNSQAAADTLSYAAVSEFIKQTHARYKKEVGSFFGTVIPAVFTDEPQYKIKEPLFDAFSRNDAAFPWTDDLPQTYFDVYGEDIVESLPELVWDMADGKISEYRYKYYDHVCQRFTDSFIKQCSRWCNENGIAFSGHMFSESSLNDQAKGIGECMRQYPYFDIPGVDVLCDWVELNTLKQAQSVVHQYGKNAMMSEMYGVTKWNFDFRGHKFQGDWQAALGVTIRVPHLSWVSMKGCAKRDYPASINYQSPWYKEYSYIENHFARLNTVLTRGKPIVDTAVIHPIESYWLYVGPYSTSGYMQSKLDDGFKNITNWLLTGMIDFDFISEALLPEQYVKSEDCLCVGCMKYNTVIVANCVTLRKTTVDILNEFVDNGGKLIIAGDIPKCIDAIETDEIKKLIDKATRVPLDCYEITRACSTDIKVIGSNGLPVKNLIHTYRKDIDCRWLFLAHCKKNTNIDVPDKETFTIILKGEFIPELYDTVNGKIYTPTFETQFGKTYIYCNVYGFDSILLRLKTGRGKNIITPMQSKRIKKIDFKNPVAYRRHEDNVYILDIAEYCLDDGNFEQEEEILRIDKKCRDILELPLSDGNNIQPWVIGEETICHFVTLRFKVMCEVDVDDVYLAGEEAVNIIVNNKEIEIIPQGWFVDEDIKKYYIGSLPMGENIIEIKTPLGKTVSIENYYLLGDFDVNVAGCTKKIMPKKQEISFGDITYQGLPFYGGNISYYIDFLIDKKGRVKLTVSRFRGAVIKVFIDATDCGYIAFEPYELDLGLLKEGWHRVELILFGNRGNTFGDIHNCGYSTWYGPNCWYTHGTAWSYEYVLDENGILSSPVIEVFDEIGGDSNECS